jgi:hypothetical protein
VLAHWHRAKNKVLLFTQGRCDPRARSSHEIILPRPPSFRCECTRMCRSHRGALARSSTPYPLPPLASVVDRIMLDVVEAYVQSMGYTYLRMDGTTPIKQVSTHCALKCIWRWHAWRFSTCEYVRVLACVCSTCAPWDAQRQRLVDKFNEDEDCFVFLLTTKVRDPQVEGLCILSASLSPCACIEVACVCL